MLHQTFWNFQVSPHFSSGWFVRKIRFLVTLKRNEIYQVMKISAYQNSSCRVSKSNFIGKYVLHQILVTLRKTRNVTQNLRKRQSFILHGEIQFKLFHQKVSDLARLFFIEKIILLLRFEFFTQFPSQHPCRVYGARGVNFTSTLRTQTWCVVKT